MDAPILLLGGSFLACLAIGVPIAVSIGIATVATMLLAMPVTPALTTAALRMATGIDSFALLAIPFFILSGQLISQGGMAQRLVDFAKALVGGFAGGLAFVNVLASMFFGTISGSAVAATSAVGGFMIPSMEKEGYDRETSVAVTMTGSVTGLLIPPSNILIVYSLASGGVSIAALFLAGYVPGILLGLDDGRGGDHRSAPGLPRRRPIQLGQNRPDLLPRCAQSAPHHHRDGRHRGRDLHGH